MSLVPDESEVDHVSRKTSTGPIEGVDYVLIDRPGTPDPDDYYTTPVSISFNEVRVRNPIICFNCEENHNMNQCDKPIDYLLCKYRYKLYEEHKIRQGMRLYEIEARKWTKTYPSPYSLFIYEGDNCDFKELPKYEIPREFLRAQCMSEDEDDYDYDSDEFGGAFNNLTTEEETEDYHNDEAYDGDMECDESYYTPNYVSSPGKYRCASIEDIVQGCFNPYSWDGN